MKRKLALVLAGAMVLSMAACGGKDSSGADSSNTSAKTTDDAADNTADGAAASDLGYADYDQSDKYVAATEAAVYEGTDE